MKIISILLFSSIITLNSRATIPRNKELVKVSALPLISSSVLFLAEEQGYFTDESLDIKFIYAAAAQNVAITVAAGEADIGVTALTAGFYNLAGKGELKIIAGQYQEKKGWPGATYLACNSAYKNGLTSPEQTINHKMGITQTGSTFHRWYGAMAQNQNKPLNNDHLIRLQTVPAMISALASCQVDSIIMMSQVAYKLASENKAHIIGRVSDYNPGQMGVVFASQKSIKSTPDKIQRFLKAYLKASHDYCQTLIAGNDEKSKKKMLDQINKYLSPQLPENLLPKAVVYLDSNAQLDIESMKENLQWYQQQGLVRKYIHLANMLDLSILNNIERNQTP